MIIIDYLKIKIVLFLDQYDSRMRFGNVLWVFRYKLNEILIIGNSLLSFLDSNVRVAIVENTELALRCPSNTLIITVTTQLTPVEEY